MCRTCLSVLGWALGWGELRGALGELCTFGELPMAGRKRRFEQAGHKQGVGGGVRGVHRVLRGGCVERACGQQLCKSKRSCQAELPSAPAYPSRRPQPSEQLEPRGAAASGHTLRLMRCLSLSCSKESALMRCKVHTRATVWDA